MRATSSKKKEKLQPNEKNERTKCNNNNLWKSVIKPSLERGTMDSRSSDDRPDQKLLGLRFGVASNNNNNNNQTDVAPEDDPKAKEEDAYDEKKNNTDTNTDTDTADQPCPPRPIVSIELQRLLGYEPTSLEEKEEIRSDLMEAMWKRYHNENATTTNTIAAGENTVEAMPKTEPPPDFDDQIQELLKAHVAQVFFSDDPQHPYNDNNDAQNNNDAHNNSYNDKAQNVGEDGEHDYSYLEIPYPSKILLETKKENPEEAPVFGDTVQMWYTIRQLSQALEEEYDEEARYTTPTVETTFDASTNNNKHAALFNKIKYENTKNESVSDFMYHLADHLALTAQPLHWKYGMCLELQALIRQELVYRQQQRWVRGSPHNTEDDGGRRKHKLEQLYSVRETIVHRTDLARTEYQTLLARKDIEIRKDLILYDNTQRRVLKQQQQQQQQQKFYGSSNGESTTAMLMDFPEEFQLLGLLPKDHAEERLYEEDDWGGSLNDEYDDDMYGTHSSCSSSNNSTNTSGDDSNDDYSNHDADDDDDDYAAGDEHNNENHDQDTDKKAITAHDTILAQTTPAVTTSTPASIISAEGAPTATAAAAAGVPKPFLRKNRQRRQKKAREERKRQEREEQRNMAIKQRRDHEEYLNQKHTTKKLIVAQTVLEALQKKVENVEELLETIQDEVWAAEEAQEEQMKKGDDAKHEAPTLGANNNNNSSSRGIGGEKTTTPTMSLLDQILAMILGGLPMEPIPKQATARTTATEREQEQQEQEQQQQQHFRYIKEEHDLIVNGWTNYFGRLPSVFVNSNDDDDDDTDDDDGQEGRRDNDKVRNAIVPGITARTTTIPTTKLSSLSAPKDRTQIFEGTVDNDKNDTGNVVVEPSRAASIPTTRTPFTSPREQRMALGIVDNETEEWDIETDVEHADDDDDASRSIS